MGDPFNAEREARAITDAVECLPGCFHENHAIECARHPSVFAEIVPMVKRVFAAGLDAAAEECEPVRRMYASSGRDAGIASGAVKCMDRIRSLAKKTRGKP